MRLTRPDLNNISQEVRSYIESLESEIERLGPQPFHPRKPSRSAAPVEVEEEPEELPETTEPAEAPTTVNVITITASGIAKRTPRHLYSRQRRGGMGVFDIETNEDDPPRIICLADQSQNLLLITNLAHAYRLPVNAIPESPVHARGVFIIGRLNLPPEEFVAAALSEQAQGYLVLTSQSGMVRMLRHHVFGDSMKPGTSLYDLRAFGPLASACWTPGEGDLFVASRQGKAIRFSEKQIPPQGTQAIRLTDGDQVAGTTAVHPDSTVLLLGTDGKGTLRQMESFAPNKAPGSGGKIAFNTNELVCAMNTDDQEDIFIISRLSKIIRFRVEDVPAKEGVVQGVNCMALRADKVAAAALNASTSPF